MKRYNFRGTTNTRDLGGYSTIDGYYTKYHTLIRSDAPFNLCEKDVQLLLDLRITTIIDLRNINAAERNPNCLFGNSDFQYYNCPMTVNPRDPKYSRELAEIYIEIASNKETMSAVMKTIANAPNGVLFHCEEGKDRTGILSAILLSLANVFDEDILADYEITSIYLRKYMKLISEQNKDIPDFWVDLKCEYMEEFLKIFYKKFQSAENYLHILGLTDEAISKIKCKLLNK